MMKKEEKAKPQPPLDSNSSESVDNSPVDVDFDNQSKYGKLAGIIIAVILLLLGSVAAVNFMLTGSVFVAKSCTYEGLEFASGSEIDIDECNSCSCTDGEIQCTLIACEEELGEDDNIIPLEEGSKADVYTLICGSFAEPFSADIAMNIPDEMYVFDVVFLEESVGEECYLRVNYLNSSMEIGLAPGDKIPVELLEDRKVASFEATDIYLTKVSDPTSICQRFEMDAACGGYLSVYSNTEESKYFEGILGVNEVSGQIVGLAKVAISPEDSEQTEMVLEKFSELISESEISAF